MPRGTILGQKIKFERARVLFFRESSKGYMNAKLALLEVGYAERSAAQHAPFLFKGVNKQTEVDPLKTEQLEVEIGKWLKLMSNWREKLEEVADPMSLDSKTYSVISGYIERLSKLAGLIKSEGGDVNINLSSLPHPEMYQKLTAMITILFQKVRDLEKEMNLKEIFSLN